MDIFMMQYIYRNKHLVLVDSDVNVYKYDRCKFDKPFLYFQAKNNFIGKSKICPMTDFFQAEYKEEFDGNTFLLECENNEYVYISGLEIFNFKTGDKFIDYIFLIGNNMIPYTFAVGERYTYFLSSHYKFIENDRFGQGTLLNATNNSLNPYDYHVEKCSKNAFKKLERTQIQNFWPGFEEHEENEVDYLVEEDEENDDLIDAKFNDGNNEVVKIFSQKCVICLERDSIHAFRQCCHQCICEQCYQNKGDIDIIKCVVRRT